MSIFHIIDSFHIVSAHAPNCLVLRYLREITREGAIFIRLPIHYTVEYVKDEKKKMQIKIRLIVKIK